MKLIIALGNPGKKYHMNRHNIGWRIIDHLVEKIDNSDWKNSTKFKSELYELSHCNCLIAKPTTFMNLSGESAKSLVKFHKLNPEMDILVVHDDKDMILGKIRLKTDSSAGGHNGVKSIIDHLGTQKFHRLKFGVGHKNQKIPTDAFVLQNFLDEEEKELPKKIEKASEEIKKWLKK